MSETCEYCKNGKSFNQITFGDAYIDSHILGNELRTVVNDDRYEDEDIIRYNIITHCPFCGETVHEEPDEEIEEV